jgi:hypothetical protein
MLILSACATSANAPKAGAFDSDNALHYKPAASSSKSGSENGIVILVSPYVDNRADLDVHHLGEITARVIGLTGHSLMVDRVVADISTDVYQRRFQAAGYTVVDTASTTKPAFELSGVVRRLTVNSKNRDEVDIAIETSVKDVATGKIIWSALVTEKGDRFAGVAGNSKNDLVDYLNHSLGVVANKTVDAVNALLMASYPQLFNLTPGTKIIPGVTVYSAPLTQAPAASVVAPVVAVVAAAPAAVTGTLVLNGKPARAKVRLDGVYFGLIPLRTELATGIHEVEVQAVGYKIYSEKISIRKGEVTELDVSLKR